MQLDFSFLSGEVIVGYVTKGFPCPLQLPLLAMVGGILLWVASNMIKVSEIREVAASGRFQTFMMVYTAIMVPLTDFLTGVLSALILYALAWFKFRSSFTEGDVEQTCPTA